MSVEKTKENIVSHKKVALSKLELLMDKFIESDASKADKFNYWIEDYSKFLDYEQQFNPKKLKRYKRGEIIKAHLGFNIGSEEGGLHYCIVLDKENNLSSSIITVVPITSVKNEKRLKYLRKGEVYIKNDLYNALEEKIKTSMASVSQKMDMILDLITSADDIDTAVNKFDFLKLEKEIDSIKNMQHEINKMKEGSIALVGQITTISKIRIYTPKTKYDVLSNVRLSNESLDLIDAELQNLFIGKK